MRLKKAVYNIFTNLFLQCIIILYGFIVPKIIIGKYGSNVNGLMNSITQFLSYIALLESGVGPVVKATLYKPLAQKNHKEIVNIVKTTEKFFRRIAYVFIGYIIILSILYPMLVSNEFDYLYTVSLLVIISISTFAEYYFGMTYRLLIQADQKTYVISIIQILTYVFSMLTIIFMAKMNVSIHILKLFSSFIFLIRPIAQYCYVKRKYRLNMGMYDNDYKISNKWDGLAQHIAYVIHNNTDITILTIFSSLTNVSIYSVYMMVNKGIKSIMQSFTNGIDSSWGDMIAKKEEELLNNKFNIYELLYMIILTIVFSSTLILIIPFVKVYTLNITDANYIVPLFGFLIVLSEYIWGIRLPYLSICYAAGHFKETRNGAWLECIINIVISILLVNIFGLVGVAIGTITAMTIRTIEFIYHTNKYILKRSLWKSIKKIITLIIETISIYYMCGFLPFIDNISYFNWCQNAIMVLFVSSSIVFLTSIIFYKNELIEIIKLGKRYFSRKKTNNFS